MRALRELAKRIGTDAEPRDAELVVTLDGVPVHVVYELRTLGSTSTKWTTVGVRSADMPGKRLAWNLNVRRQRPSDAQDIREGYLRDLVFDDPPFDDMFLVEAAPEDAVRALFDARARRELVALAPPYIMSTKTFGIELAWDDEWIDDVDRLERAARLIGRLGATFVHVAHEAAEDRRRRAAAKGYRDVALTTEDVHRERAEDIRAFEAQRARRRKRDGRIALVVLVIALLVIGAFIWGISWLVDFGKAHGW